MYIYFNSFKCTSKSIDNLWLDFSSVFDFKIAGTFFLILFFPCWLACDVNASSSDWSAENLLVASAIFSEEKQMKHHVGIFSHFDWNVSSKNIQFNLNKMCWFLITLCHNTGKIFHQIWQSAVESFLLLPLKNFVSISHLHKPPILTNND